MNAKVKRAGEMLKKVGMGIWVMGSIFFLDNYVGNGDFTELAKDLFNQNTQAATEVEDPNEWIDDLTEEEATWYYEITQAELVLLDWQSKPNGAVELTQEGVWVKQTTDQGTFLLTLELNGEIRKQHEYPQLNEEETLNEQFKLEAMLSRLHYRLTGVGLAF